MISQEGSLRAFSMYALMRSKAGRPMTAVMKCWNSTSKGHHRDSGSRKKWTEVCQCLTFNWPHGESFQLLLHLRSKRWPQRLGHIGARTCRAFLACPRPRGVSLDRRSVVSCDAYLG